MANNWLPTTNAVKEYCTKNTSPTRKRVDFTRERDNGNLQEMWHEVNIVHEDEIPKEKKAQPDDEAGSEETKEDLTDVDDNGEQRRRLT